MVVVIISFERACDRFSNWSDQHKETHKTWIWYNNVHCLLGARRNSWPISRTSILDPPPTLTNSDLHEDEREDSSPAPQWLFGSFQPFSKAIQPQIPCSQSAHVSKYRECLYTKYLQVHIIRYLQNCCGPWFMSNRFQTTYLSISVQSAAVIPSFSDCPIWIMDNRPSFWLPFADWGQAPWWMQGLLPKKTSAGQNGSSATNFNKPSPSVFLSVEFVCWHPYKSQVQHFEEFKTLKKMLLNNMLDFLKFTISAFVNNFWSWRSFQVTVPCLYMVVSPWMKTIFLASVIRLQPKRTP